MNIVIGADHAGVELKAAVKQFLIDEGYTVLDVGTDSTESVDYPDYARKLVRYMDKDTKGILICGTGIGMSIMANRCEGIRCAVATSAPMAVASRAHNNANVLALGARLIDEATAFVILRAFLDTAYEGGRHDRRICKFDRHISPFDGSAC